jgi:3-ketosteroid 9alpha-monooxygenase subunit A
MCQAPSHGWYLVSFAYDLNRELMPVSIGPERLVLVRAMGRIRAFSADCPHRGAHLAYGGKLDGDAILCPFHRFRIALGRGSGDESRELYVRERHTLVVGDLVFIRLSDNFDNGFSEMIQEIARTHVIQPGYVWDIKVPAALVIENNFDPAHFRPVHCFDVKAISTQIDPLGSLNLTGNLALKGRFEHGKVQFLQSDLTHHDDKTSETGIPIAVKAFSPGLSVLRVGGEYPYGTIVGATPSLEGQCTLRVSLALPRAIYGDTPNSEILAYFLEQIKAGIEDDMAIWEHISISSTNRFMDTDTAVVEFRNFCKRFEEP